jgi:hypothetical protein
MGRFYNLIFLFSCLLFGKDGFPLSYENQCQSPTLQEILDSKNPYKQLKNPETLCVLRAAIAQRIQKTINRQKNVTPDSHKVAHENIECLQSIYQKIAEQLQKEKKWNKLSPSEHSLLNTFYYIIDQERKNPSFLYGPIQDFGPHMDYFHESLDFLLKDESCHQYNAIQLFNTESSKEYLAKMKLNSSFYQLPIFRGCNKFFNTRSKELASSSLDMCEADFQQIKAALQIINDPLENNPIQPYHCLDAVYEQMEARIDHKNDYRPFKGISLSADTLTYSSVVKMIKKYSDLLKDPNITKEKKDAFLKNNAAGQFVHDYILVKSCQPLTSMALQTNESNSSKNPLCLDHFKTTPQTSQNCTLHALSYAIELNNPNCYDKSFSAPVADLMLCADFSMKNFPRLSDIESNTESTNKGKDTGIGLTIQGFEKLKKCPLLKEKKMTLEPDDSISISVERTQTFPRVLNIFTCPGRSTTNIATYDSSPCKKSMHSLVLTGLTYSLTPLKNPDGTLALDKNGNPLMDQICKAHFRDSNYPGIPHSMRCDDLSQGLRFFRDKRPVNIPTQIIVKRK